MAARVARRFLAGAVDEDDFVGFHCKQREHRGKFDGYIGKEYGSTWLPQVVQNLPFKMQDELAEITGLDKWDIPGEYDEGFDEWAEEVEDFLYRKGIHWIFVSENRPLTNFGRWCYRVYLDESRTIAAIPDHGVGDSATVYLYDSRKMRPVLVEHDDDDW